MKKSIFIIIALILIYGCEKENQFFGKETESSEIEQMQTGFAKIFAAALNESLELRKLIKNKSLEMFDNDYDVLYQSIKNETIEGVKLSEFLKKYDESNKLPEIESSLPLLTIFVPILPNFNPEEWDYKNEIPKVAVSNPNSVNVLIFDAFGEKTLIEEGLIPGFPLVVVKQNERIQVGQSSNKSAKTYSEGDFVYSFLDEAFDGSIENNNKRVTLSSGIDPVNIRAYNLGLNWHRDYVYYGLTPTNTSGKYRNNYSEFITSFKMLSSSWYGKIADQTGDPVLLRTKHRKRPAWTDGFFEFKVEVLINSTNGAGSTLTKYFSAKGSDLADVIYKRFFFNLYKVDKVNIKAYNPNLELIPWDLKNYGMAWKFIISEVDPSEEYTYTEEVSTSFATNFSVEGTIKKIGLKFGASATKSSKSTCTRKIKKDSDNLGEAILTFDQPIIIGKKKSIYFTREISTGWCSLAVEPKKIY